LVITAFQEHQRINSGCDWIAINIGVAPEYALAVAIDPSTASILYTGPSGGGVYRSGNGGGNWSAVNTGLIATSVYALAIDPVTPTWLYVGTHGRGVFNSINGGGTWSTVNTGLVNHLGCGRTGHSMRVQETRGLPDWFRPGSN